MKHLFLLFTCAVISLQGATEGSAPDAVSPCDRVYFPNYFKWLGNDEEALRLVNQSIGSVLKQLKISHFNGDVYTNRDFFEHINDVVQEKAPGAKVYISGGVVRSILGYIYKKMYNQAEREGHIEGSQDLVLDVFNRIIGAKSRKYDPTLADMRMYEGDRSKNEKDLIPLDALGIGSDYDILIEFPEGFAGHKQTVMQEVKDFINSADIQFGMQGDDSALKHMIVPYADVSEYQQQMGEAASEGGSLLDLLAYPVTGGEIREPVNYAGKDQYPSIMQSFFMGKANYVTGTKQPHNPTKQTIRGLRPLLEIPFLKVDEASQRVMVEELQKITSLDHASQLQLDKMTRNARFQGAHNRFGIDCTQDGALSMAVKDLAKRLGWENLISEFADKRSITPTVQDQELETLLMPMNDFIAQYTAKDEAGNPTGVLYHGTPKIDNLLSMLRSGLLISRPQEGDKKGQGAAAFGRGVYTTPDLSTAEDYAGSDGIVIPLNVNTHKPFRILDVRQSHVQAWLQKHKLMLDNIPNTEKLYHDYGIDVVIVNYNESAAPLIQNQEVLSIPKDIPFLIQSMQQNVMNKIKRDQSIPSHKILQLFDPSRGYSRLLKTLNPTIDTFQIALQIALECIKRRNWNIQDAALQLFQALFEKGQGYGEAIAAASAGMESRNFNIRFFKSLFEKEQAYDLAIQAASEGVKMGNLNAPKLFKALFLKEKGYQEAIQAVSEVLRSDKNWAKADAVQLILALFEKLKGDITRDHHLDLIIKAASEGIKVDDQAIQQRAFELFKALFEKLKGDIVRDRHFDLAIQAALAGIHQQPIQQHALDIFQDLFKKEQGYEKAIDAASKGIESTDDKIRSSALQLFKALFEKGQGYEKAIDAASKGIESTDDKIRSSALQLFKALFEKGQGYEKAIDAASKGMESTDDDIRFDSLKLFKALFEKEQGYEKAIDAASKGIESTDDKIRSSAFKLFQTLVEKGQGYEKAIDAASKGMNSQDWFVQNGSFRLFNALVAKGQQITIVKALKEKRIPIEKIMKITGLSRERVEGIV